MGEDMYEAQVLAKPVGESAPEAFNEKKSGARTGARWLVVADVVGDAEGLDILIRHKN